MPIKNSFAVTAGLHVQAVEAMCRATATESLEGIKDRVVRNTPRRTGALRESVTPSAVTKGPRDSYIGNVSSSLEYAPYIEYGTAPHIIEPRDMKALSFNGVVRARVEHPGNRAHHMFRRGGLEFQQMGAARIARQNAKQYLGAV
jgi:hypothetical protein